MLFALFQHHQDIALSIDQLHLIGIGSGGNYAMAAAKALNEVEGLSAEDIARKAMQIAGDIDVYTNHNVIIEKI